MTQATCALASGGADSDRPASLAAVRYFGLLVILTLTIALASFVRDRGQLYSNVSLWLFASTFLFTLYSLRVGYLLSLLLLTVSPALHEQLNALLDLHLHAWAFPGVDSILGFLAAWTLRGGIGEARYALGRFPGAALLCLHAWIAISALGAVARNIWQSGSEFSLRGLVYNVWLIRGISWHDDYYPLQDLFFYSVALATFVSAWSLLLRAGHRLMQQTVVVALFGAALNTAFALWQKGTGKGWVNGKLEFEVNALWPDLHSFGGFMAAAMLLGFGVIVTQRDSTLRRASLSIATAIAAYGLFLSTSRSTLLLVFLALLAWSTWAMTSLKGWRRIMPVLVIALVLLLIDWMLVRGYRGVSYETLRDALNIVSPATVNGVLSQRPEIWLAAIKMYSGFPVFGLGQGTFYRLSSISDFSGSEALVSLGGSGAHNYFLQSLVELGLVGVTIATLTAVPFVLLGKRNLRTASFYALLGIALANVYAHSLLVRETLMFLSVIAACYVWEAQRMDPGLLRMPVSLTRTPGVLILSVLLLAALSEFGLSFWRFPFDYGQRCRELLPLSKDRWTLGGMTVPVPPGATTAEISLFADRPDLTRRAMQVTVAVASATGLPLHSVSLDFRPGHNVHDLLIPLTTVPDGKRNIEIRASNCYVPLNLGITYDPRRLGVRVVKLNFSDVGGPMMQ